MKNPFKSIIRLMTDHQEEWYFLPVVGIGFLILIMGLIFLVLTASIVFSGRSQSDPPADQPEEEITQESSEPSTDDISDFAEISREPLPTPTHTPSPSPTPTPVLTTTPSPTPIPDPQVRIHHPTHQSNYSGDTIEIDMEVISPKRVDRFEIILNGSTKQTFTNNEKKYKTTLTGLKPDAYKLKGKAFFSDGTDLTSGELKFGLGGTDWNATPTPTPSPSPSPTPTPTPSPTPSD